MKKITIFAFLTTFQIVTAGWVDWIPFINQQQGLNRFSEVTKIYSGLIRTHQQKNRSQIAYNLAKGFEILWEHELHKPAIFTQARNRYIESLMPKKETIEKLITEIPARTALGDYFRDYYGSRSVVKPIVLEKFLKRYSAYKITDVNKDVYNNKSHKLLHWILTKKCYSDFDINNNNHKQKVVHAVTALLRWGANVNKQDFRGNTPLHYAIKTENLEALKLLLQAGANVNIQNNKGDTPLLKLVKQVAMVDPDKEEDEKESFFECADALLACAPDVSIADNCDNSWNVLLSDKKCEEIWQCNTLRAKLLKEHQRQEEQKNEQEKQRLVDSFKSGII